MLLGFLWLFLSLIPSPHEYHVSVCELKSSEDGKLNISWRLITADLDEAIKELKPDFSIDQYEANPDALEVGEYLLNNFSVRIDGTEIPIRFVGMEFGYHESWAYLESEEKATGTKIEIRNTCLVDLFTDQQNYVNWVKKENTVGHAMTRENTTVSFDF